MHKLSRRSAVKATAATLAAATFPLPAWLGGAARAATNVRYEASTPNGQLMLAKYKVAVAKMQLLDVGDPCSWTFQWYTHFIKGALSISAKAGEVAGLPAAQQPLANAMWDTCQNHLGLTTEEMFLPWHRMYIYYFERICRHVLNDDTFTLPYWNYNATATGALPAPFLSPADQANALWFDNRKASSNAGAAMAGLSLECLKQTDYLGFSASIDVNPHGQLHVQVGNQLGMGAVPWAANDPIFYLHHCNIDRLWASWNADGNANPFLPAWEDQTFTFADPSPAGCVAVTPKVGDVTNTGNLGYSYDRLEPITDGKLHWPFRRELLLVNPILLKGPGPVELSGAVSTVALSLTNAAASNLLLRRNRFSALTRSKRVYVMLDGLMANAQPGVSYDLFLDTEPEKAPDRAHWLGNINFFGAVMVAGGKMPAPQVAFDATELVSALQRPGTRHDRLFLRLVPDGVPAEDARPTVAAISIRAA